MAKKKVSELTEANVLSSSDFFLITTPVASRKMTTTNLRKNLIKGPFANDSVAANSFVLVGEPYYTASGDVKVRIA